MSSTTWTIWQSMAPENPRLHELKSSLFEALSCGEKCVLKLVVGSSDVSAIDAACSSIVRACHEHLKICKLERDAGLEQPVATSLFIPNITHTHIYIYVYIYICVCTHQNVSKTIVCLQLKHQKNDIRNVCNVLQKLMLHCFMVELMHFDAVER